MKINILEKLRNVLNEDISNEIQVVYVLSRTRKILEIDKKKPKYEILNFYCDWALHSKIDRFKDDGLMNSILQKFIDDPTSGFLDFKDFHKSFKEFLKEYELETMIYKDTNSLYIFNKILCDIYKDSPLILYIKKGKKITINDVTLNKDNDHILIGFNVEDI